MSPDDLQDILDFRPFRPLRLTLSSGDVIDLRHREGLSVSGLSLLIQDADVFGNSRFRIVSVPNIALIDLIPEGESGRRLQEEGEQ